MFLFNKHIVVKNLKSKKAKFILLIKNLEYPFFNLKSLIEKFFLCYSLSSTPTD